MEQHIKNLGSQHESYLQDTPHFLRIIEEINQCSELPQNAILATIDVSALYTNIPQEEGMECVKEALEERDNIEVPTDFIIRLLEIILKYNIFEFNNELYQQLIGTAMGTRPAPPYANIFMARRIDNKIKDISTMFQNNRTSLMLFKRFLDDIFMIFTGSTITLHEFMEEVNQIHPSIKFTMSHTSLNQESEDMSCSCEKRISIPSQ